MTLILNGGELNSRYQLHEKIAEGLSFPEWYGRNLDALNDCLTDISEETFIRIECFSALEEKLGRYAALLKKVLVSVAEENKNIHIEIQ